MRFSITRTRRIYIFALFVMLSVLLLPLQWVSLGAANHSGSWLRQAFEQQPQGTPVRLVSLEQLDTLPLTQASNDPARHDPRRWSARLDENNLRQQEIFPGVDLVFAGNKQKLEAVLIVKPGADLNAVRFDFPQAESLTADAQGNIWMIASDGDLGLLRARVLCENKEVEGGFFIKSGGVSLRVKEYDATQPLLVRFDVVFPERPLNLLDQILFRVFTPDARPNLPNAPSAVTISATKSASPATVAPGGTLMYTVQITNNGDTDATGVKFTDTIDANTTLVAGSVNIQPLAYADTYNVIGNVRIQPTAAAGLLVNDCDPNNTSSGANCVNTGLAVSVLAGDSTAPFAGTSTQGGQVTSSVTDGSFIYNPPPGFTGTDTFTYTVRDAGADGIPGNADDKTDTATVTLHVGNGTATPGTNVIWFIDPAAAAGGDGRLTNPFNCYTGPGASCFSTTAADDPGDTIFLYAGAHTGGYTLLNNEKLIGAGASAMLLSLTGFTLPANSDALPATGGASPTLTTTNVNAVPLAQGNLLRGFTIGNTGTGTKISGSSFGTLTVGDSTTPDMTLNGTGQALNLTTGTFAATSAFTSVTTTSSSTSGLTLTSVAGTVAFGSTTVSGNNNECIVTSTSTADINYGNTSCSVNGIVFSGNTSGTRTFGTLSVTAGAANAFSHSGGGGNVTVNGAATLSSVAPDTIVIQNAANGNAINFAGGATVNKTGAAGEAVQWSMTNTGATLTFATLALTTSNATGMSLSGGGTVNVTTALGSSISATGDASHNGAAIIANGIALGTNFTSVSSTNNGFAGSNGISLTSVTGTSNFGSGAISGSAGDAFFISGQNGSFTYNGTITSGSAHSVNVTGKTGGTVTFGGTITDTDTGITLTSNTGGTIDFSGGTKTLNTGTNTAVTLSSNTGATINFSNGGLNVDTTSATAFSVTGGGTVNVTGASNTIDSTSGTAFLNSGTGGSATIAINAAISNTTGRLIDIQGRTANNVTLSGNLSNSGTGILVKDNNTSGTIDFSGGTKTLNTAGSAAVTLDNNDNVTINFSNGGLNIDTTSGVGFNAINGGTVNVTTGANNNTIDTDTGIGINIQTPTNIGGSGVTFRSITVDNGASNSAASGIRLNGTTGSFIVTGDGTLARNGSGGTIHKTTDDAIDLTSASNVTLQSMNLTNNGDTAPDGTTSENTTGDHTVQINGGSNVVLSGILIDSPTGGGYLALNLGGTNRINSSSLFTNFADGQRHGIFVNNVNTNMTLFEFKNSTMNNSLNDSGMFVFENSGTSNMTLDVKGSTFENLDVQALSIFPGGTVAGTTGTLTATVGGPNMADRNSFQHAHSFVLSGVTFSAENNVGVVCTNGATGDVTIENNLFDDIAEEGQIGGTSVIRTQNAGGKLTALVKNNQIQNINYATGAGGRHIIGHVFEPSSYTSTDYSNITITGNTATNITYTSTNREFVFVDFRQFSSKGNVTISNNNFNMTSAGSQQAMEVRFRQANSSNVNVSITGNTGTFNTTGQYIDVNAEEEANLSTTITGNNFTDNETSNGNGIHITTEDNVAPMPSTPTHCANISGNTLTGTNTIFLEESVEAMTIQQASSAALSSANGSATVTINGTPTFNTTCTTLPTAAQPIEEEIAPLRSNGQLGALFEQLKGIGSRWANEYATGRAKRGNVVTHPEPKPMTETVLAPATTPQAGVKPNWAGYFNSTVNYSTTISPQLRAVKQLWRPVLAAFSTSRSYLNPLALFERPAAAAEASSAKLAPASTARPALKQSAQDRPARNDQARDGQERPSMPERPQRLPVRVLKSLAGETVMVGGASGFTLPAGKSVTIMFSVTVTNSMPPGVFQVCNQGSVSGTNFSPAVNTTNACTTVCVTPIVQTALNSPTVCQGATATFTTTVYGNAPFNFVWKQNGTTVNNGGLGGRATITTTTDSMAHTTTSSLQLSNTMLSDATSYTADATSAACATSTANQSATLTVNPAPATPTITPSPATVCGNSLGNMASGPAGATTYAWSITNGTITSATNLQTITYTAGASGNVGLMLTVTNASSCSASNSINVPISGSPSTPTITPTPAQVCANSTGNMASGPAGATTYAWSITNGTITSATNIQTITYTAGASGTVMLGLTVTNAANCSASNAANVTINPVPATPTITPSPAQVCANSTGNMASGPAGATTYAWTIANGTITSASNIQNITYTAGASGSVTLNLTVSNGSCSASNSTMVTINANPTPPTITPSPATVCGNSTGNMASGPAGATTYAWTIGNGTITSAINIQTISYTAGASGNVTLNLTVTNAAGCGASNSTMVPISAAPATPTITPTPAQVCANSTGNMASGPAGATTYAWSITNGTITSATNLQTITYTAGASGMVMLSLTVTNAAGCSASNSTNVTINANPTATITPTPAAVCANSTGNMASGPAGATSYAWSISNGTITSASNIQTITYTAGASGTVLLSLTVTNATSCSASTSTNVTINANPSPPALTPSPAQVCASSTGNMASGPAGATTYAWSISNGTITSASNIQTITYTAGASGMVMLSLTVTNASNCSASNSTNVTINANPSTPTITPGAATVCPGSTGNTASGPAGATTYAWSITNGTITSATNIQNISYTAGGAGTIMLNLTVTNAAGCSASNSANVSASDASNPMITCPPNQTNVPATTGQCSATVNPGTASATDNCGTPTISFTRSDGQLTLSAPYLVGTTTITWKATDAANNMATCMQTITVKDTQAPVITCPANQTGVTNGVATTATVIVPNPTATDNCDASPTINCTRSDGQLFSNTSYPLGTTTVTCTASDHASPANTSGSCSFTVVVRTPRAAVNNLKTQVQALVPGTLTQTQANSLLSFLELAGTHLEQGLNSAACTDLGNFVNQCNALTPPLSSAQNLALVSAANKIRNALGVCGGPFSPAKRAGVFSAERGEFYLKQRLTTGLPDQVERYGEAGDLPVAGDWDGKGIDSLGVYRQGVFYLRPARLADADGNPTGQEIVVEFGLPGDLPVVGDWDGDGIDTIGVYRQGQFLLRNSNRAGPADIVLNFGEAGDLPLAGDWDGDGQVTIGVYNPTTGLFKLSNTLKNVLADVVVQWGGPGYWPVVGDWDGDGVTTIGLYGVGGEFLLRNTNTAGTPDLIFTLGVRGGLPVAGRWGDAR